MFCDCKQDGHCTRYNRFMGGRWREICSGVNVDLGTAAAFRQQWLMESGMPESNTAPKALVLKTNQAPGDAVAMTAAIHSLHNAHPGKFKTAVQSLYPEVFEYNPYVTTPTDDDAPVEMHYPAIHQSNNRGIHFMQGWCEFIGAALGIAVPLMTNRPMLFFKEPAPSTEDYWIICSGGKFDFTNKLWGYHNYQTVVDILWGRVNFVQVGTVGQNEYHPAIYKAENLVGKTSLRELFDVVRKARGVLCGVSLLMHVAAALEKPAVVVAGGREPVPWNAYPKQRYIHTVGSLPCRDINGKVGGACWRSRTVPLGDGINLLDSNTCEFPVRGTPKCMALISPEYVAETILQVEGELS